MNDECLKNKSTQKLDFVSTFEVKWRKQYKDFIMYDYLLEQLGLKEAEKTDNENLKEINDFLAKVNPKLDKNLMLSVLFSNEDLKMTPAVDTTFYDLDLRVLELILEKISFSIASIEISETNGVIHKDLTDSVNAYKALNEVYQLCKKMDFQQTYSPARINVRGGGDLDYVHLFAFGRTCHANDKVLVNLKTGEVRENLGRILDLSSNNTGIHFRPDLYDPNSENLNIVIKSSFSRLYNAFAQRRTALETNVIRGLSKVVK